MRKLIHSSPSYIRLEPDAGGRIDIVARDAALVALEEDVPVSFVFNGTLWTADPNVLLQTVCKTEDGDGTEEP